MSSDQSDSDAESSLREKFYKRSGAIILFELFIPSTLLNRVIKLSFNKSLALGRNLGSKIKHLRIIYVASGNLVGMLGISVSVIILYIALKGSRLL